MAADPHSIWVDIEVLAVRIAAVGFLVAVTLFAGALGLGLLLVGVQLSDILAPLGRGVTLLALLGGVAISTLVFSEIVPVIRNLFGVGFRLISAVSFREGITSASTMGRWVAYVGVGLIATGSYAGLHGWAHRVASISGTTSRLVVPSTPSQSLLLLIIDVAAATAGLAAIGFVAAAIAHGIDRLCDVVSVDSWNAHDRRQFRATVFPAVVTATDLEANEINYELLVDFTTRVGIGSVLVSGFALGIGVLVRFFRSTSVAELVPIALDGGVLKPVVGPQTTLVIAVIGGLVFLIERRRLLQTARVTVRPIKAVLWFGIAVMLYATAVRNLSTTRSNTPPTRPPSVEAVDGPLLAPVQLIDVVFFAPAYFELARIFGVAAALAISVPLYYGGRHWWNESRLLAGLAWTRTTLSKTTRPLTLFSSRMVVDETAPRWAHWVRVGMLVQLFGLGLVLQTVSSTSRISGAAALLGVGMLCQAACAVLDLRARYGTLNGWQRGWPFVILAVPILGGVGYVLREY